MRTHAAVPFARHVGGDDFLVYVSGRDERGRSHTGLLEVQIKDVPRVLGVRPEPVLRPGAPGAFDDSGAMLSWVTPRGDGVTHLYYIGWNRGVDVPFRNALGLAIETGTSPARKWGGQFGAAPLLDRGVHDPAFTASCCVLRESTWRMWYVSGLRWDVRAGAPHPLYHIKYAESEDGITWRRNGRVSIDFANEHEHAISRPSVLTDAEGYHMWYSVRGDRYRIGYARSADGLTWTRDDGLGLAASGDGWDASMVEYPHVFDHAGTRYMLFNGDGYGRTGLGAAVLER